MKNREKLTVFNCLKAAFIGFSCGYTFSKLIFIPLLKKMFDIL
jgi:hypothetical protein